MAPRLVFMSLFLLHSTLFFFSLLTETGEAAGPSFTATFYFGDSTMDTGNNVNMNKVCFVRADHAPYGRDLVPGGGVSGGRFSNGKVIPDLLSSALGLKQLVPPFLNPHLADSDLTGGVSFASAGSGYDDPTAELSGAMSLSSQVALFGGGYLSRLKQGFGDGEAGRIVGGALAVISSGSTDYTMKYLFHGQYDKLSDKDYNARLLWNLGAAIKDLYGYGLRKFVVVGPVPIGCTPFVITVASKRHPSTRHWVDKANSLSAELDSKLEEAVRAFQPDLPGSTIEHFDVYNVLTDMISRAGELGFEVSDKGCCGTGLVEAGPMCSPAMPTCQNASSYVFFDAFHPTERAYGLITDQIMNNIIPKFQ